MARASASTTRCSNAGRFPWPNTEAGGRAPDLGTAGHAVGRDRLAATGLGCAADPGGLIYPSVLACFYGTGWGAMVDMGMSTSAPDLPDDPAALKAMIAALQMENQKMSASLRAHDLLVQSLASAHRQTAKAEVRTELGKDRARDRTARTGAGRLAGSPG